MTPEEVAAVKAGMADFAKGKNLTEEQFQAEMSRYPSEVIGFEEMSIVEHPDVQAFRIR